MFCAVVANDNIYNLYIHEDQLNTLDARSRSTDFAQTSLRCQKSVDRRHGISTPAPEVGRPTEWYIIASRQKSVDRLCFLMHTGTGMPES